jgi:two-component system NtrC family sensor kinase
MRVEAMKKRSSTGGKAAKARPRSALGPKGRSAPKTLSNRRSAADNSESEVARLKRELREALEQQTATSEVLQIISSSLGELQPVFEAMLEKAVRICDAKFGNIYRWDNATFDLVATFNTPPALAKARRRSPVRPIPGNLFGRMLATKAAIHVADLAADERYVEQRDPTAVAGVELGGIRTLIAVPMLKDKELIGALRKYLPLGW